MTQAELSTRSERAHRETFVIKKTDEGFRVYPPGNPTRNYLVVPEEGSPTCTCPDFEAHAHDPDWRCKHILAVEYQAGARHPSGDEPEGVVLREERTAVQEESRPSGAPRQSANGTSQMLLKRSVSPDGRIDSLSVEFTCPAANVPAQEIKRHARRVLELQSEIVDDFLGTGGSGKRRPIPEGGAGDEAIDARLLRIGGIDTRWGRRLFIHVQVNGDTLKLFGSRKQLAEAIEAAGYPDRAERIGEGIALNLPCKVTTKPSDDGRYVNVDAVFPVSRRGNGRGGR